MSNVKVCVLSYNRGSYLKEAISSILSQTCKPFLIEILDNGSDPSVFDAIRPWVDRGDVAWLGSEKNNGVHWNLERAFSRGADSDYLYIMHDDDRLLPRFLEKQKKFLDRHPTVVAVACNSFLINKEGKRLERLLHLPWRRKSEEFFKDIPSMVWLYVWNLMIFPSVLYRSSVVRDSKINPSLGQVIDVVFLTELARKGTLGYQNMPLMEYRVHSDQDSSCLKEKDQATLDSYYSKVCKEFSCRYMMLVGMLVRKIIRPAWKKILLNARFLKS